MKNNNILAIDFGGTSIKYFLFKNEIEKAHQVSMSEPLYEKELLIEDIKTKFKAFETEHGKIAGLAISFCSPVLDDRRVRWGKISGFWEYFDLKALIAQANIIDERHITILNDAKSAGYAELKVGAAKGHKHAVMLTYGTAIGGAAFINGEVVNGPFGLGAELSNPLLGFDGKDFSSLKLWCDFGSMSFLQNKYFDLTNKRENGKTIFERFDRNEVEAKQAVDLLYKGVAIHVFNCCYTYGPSVIVIGGGLSERSQAAQEIETYVRQIEKQLHLSFPSEIKLAKAGNKAGALGAYYYFLDNMNNHN